MGRPSGGGTTQTVYTGWGYYQDGGAAQVISSTPAILQNDGSGPNTNDAFLPSSIRGSGALWDTTNDRITPIAEGDAFTLRLDLPVTAESGNPTGIDIELDIQSGTTYGTAIMIIDRVASTGRGAPYTISVGFPVFVGSTFIANGAQFWVTADTGTVTITNPAITLVRIHGEA